MSGGEDGKQEDVSKNSEFEETGIWKAGNKQKDED